jgi:hypothetical protein
MKDYKKWTAETRKQSLKLTNRAKKFGWIENPKECRRCGQTEGILHLHNEDYDITLNTLTEAFDRFPISITEDELKAIDGALEPICWRCHMIHHSVRRNPAAVKLYFEEVKQGKKFAPVYKHNFNILKYEHNIE